ncbi:interleukin-2 receptor subunit beta [Dasypus novemcinctus]|uniref:interleukin-2 receptor subunit beta n=1 Tax=Dasypus novemcinctus TaxID=9361 RepID=UPI00032901C2|nr:interleukin-2 receptor subunit beta [Dasypus novemcinctus]XP_058164762.1 interleukin-2 receptor subunit beta [Dasypus novemcinctus]
MAAPAPSWCLLVLAVLLPLAVPGPAAAKNDAARLTCFYNSRANISCLWSQNGSSPAAPCFIRAWSDKRTWNKTCNLLPVRPGSWACNLILGPHAESQSLTAAELVSLSVTCCVEERNRTVASQTFKPFQNLRLMAPDSLQVVHVGIHRCNISWSVPQFSHYLTSYLQFEAQVRPLGRSWEETPSLALKQNQQWIFLVTLAADSLHEFRVRARTQGNGYTAEWSPWSQALAFRTRPAAPGKEPLTSWLGHVIVGLSGVFGFVLLVYLLANCQSFGPWLKKVLQCHIPDPSEFFSQLSSEHGGDFQKWLSSPFPSSSFNPGGLAPEISPLEVLERDAKALKLLLPQQDKSSSHDTSGHSLASCFTNQGYFFFHLPDALEIEACQVYFTYDPCAEEPDEGGPGAPAGSPLPALLPLPGEDDAYCTFPPGEDLLLFSPSLLGGPGSPNTALGGRGADEERLPPSLQGSTPGDLAPRPLETPSPGAPDLVGLHSPREAREEAPAPSPVEARGLPWATLPGHGQGRVLTSHLPLNTDAYLSLQELQDQDPAHSV